MYPSSLFHQRVFPCTVSNFALSRRVRSTLFGLLWSIVALLVMPCIAFANLAHAEYMSSDPAANSMLAKAPSMITVHFSESIDPAGSDIIVYDVKGKLVSTAAAQVDRSDHKSMTVPMKDDKSEIYVVNWRTISVGEVHHDSGSFRFFVNISPMLKDMLGNPMSSSSMVSSPAGSMSSDPSPSSGIPTWVTVLVGILGLLIGAAAVFAVTRRSTSSPKMNV